MKRKERLLSQITEVEARLGFGVAPPQLTSGSEAVAGGMATPRRQLPPLSPLSPLSPPRTGGKPVMNEVEMLQQVGLSAIDPPGVALQTAALARCRNIGTSQTPTKGTLPVPWHKRCDAVR